jgi:hypothetical protein
MKYLACMCQNWSILCKVAPTWKWSLIYSTVLQLGLSELEEWQQKEAALP